MLFELVRSIVFQRHFVHFRFIIYVIKYMLDTKILSHDHFLNLQSYQKNCTFYVALHRFAIKIPQVSN